MLITFHFQHKGDCCYNVITITDKSVSEEQITDNSREIIEDKGLVNIRDKLKVEEKKNNRSWIEQLTTFGFVVVLLVCIGIYVKKRWF